MTQYVLRRTAFALLMMLSFFMSACSSGTNSDVVVITVPLTPLGLQAEGFDNAVTLSWLVSLGAESYIIYSSTTGDEADYIPIASVTDSVYTVANLVNDTTYWFKVVAINSLGESGFSAAASAVPNVPTVSPSMPQNVAIEASEGSVSLTWGRATLASYYNVYMSESQNGTYSLATVTAVPYAVISGLTNGTTYYFKIVAVNSHGESSSSTVISSCPSAPSNPPAVPRDVAALAGDNKVFIYWDEVRGAKSYVVYMGSALNGSYAPIATVKNTSYLAANLLNKTEYYFKVTAVNSAGQSTLSAAVSATPETSTVLPYAPSHISAVPGNGWVYLSWGVSQGAEAYNIYSSTAPNGTFTLAAASTTPSFTVDRLTNGKTYYFYITAVNSVGESTQSAHAIATPTEPVVTPPVPAALFAIPGNSQATLTWEASNGAQAYTVYESLTKDGVYTPRATTQDLTYSVYGLTNGTPYYFRVTAVNSFGESAASNTASAKPAAPLNVPAIPEAFSAVPLDGTVELTWNPSSTADSYNVYYSTTPPAPASFLRSIFSQRGVSFIKIATKTATNHTISNLENDKTYYFYVTANNVAGESVQSIVASATPTKAVVPPSAPFGLTALSGNSQATLNWNLSPNSDSYIVYMSDAEGGTYYPVATTNALTYTVLNLTNGTTYWFKVAAVNIAGQGSISAPAGVTPASPLAVPVAPLSLAAASSDSSATLAWNISRFADYYNIYVSNSPSGPFTAIGSRASNTFAVSNLTNDQTYYFYVTGVDATGEGAQSITVSVTPRAALLPPLAPLGINALPANSAVSLSWESSANANSYTIYTSNTEGGQYTPLATLSATSYSVSNLTNGTVCWFKVAAINQAGTSALSAAASAAPQKPIAIPQAPTGISAIPANAYAVISWDQQQLADSFNIYMATAIDGTYTKISSQFGTSYTAANLTNGQIYYFYVTAQNIAGESGPSVRVSASPQTPIAIPASPFGLMAGANDSQVTLSWESSVNASSYTLYLSLAENGTYHNIVTTANLTYTLSGLSNGVRYWFKVAASNESGTSDISAAISSVPNIPIVVPAAPAGLSATAYNSRVTLAWDNATDSASYNIYNSTSPTGPFSMLGNSLTPAYSATMLTNGQPYYFYITAVNQAGESVHSLTVSATPQAPVFAVPPVIYSAAAGDSQFTVTWQPVANADSYIVYASLAENGNYSPISTNSDTTYTALRVSNGTVYWLKLASVNNAGTGGQTPAFSVTPAAPILPPVAPLGLGISIGDRLVNLAWNPSAGATSYNIYYKTTANGSFILLTNRINTSYTNLEMANNTQYYFAVTAVNSAGESANSLTVTGTPKAPLYPPAPPFSVNINPGDGYAEVGWSESNGATYYTIYYSDVSATTGFYSLGTTTGRGIRIVGLPNGNSIWVKISASNTAGEGPTSNIVTTTPHVPPLPPTPPVTLSATSIDSGAILKWDNVTGAVAYTIYQNNTLNGSYTRLFGTEGLTAAIEQLINGQTYYFKVAAVNAAGEGAQSAAAYTTPIANIYPPATPSGLTATPDNAAVQLTWQATPNATKYIVYESNAPVAILTTTSFKVTGLTNGTEYTFAVTALNSAGESQPSATATATPYIPVDIPAAPASISAVAGDATAALTWGAVSNADSYNLYRSTSQNGTYSPIVTGLTVTTYTDTTVTNGTTYWYKAAAENAAGVGVYSGTVSVKPTAPVVPPSAPVILTLTSSGGLANITWTNDNTATGFNVYVATSQTGAYTLATSSTNPNATVSGLTVGQTYWFKVSALKGTLEGALSQTQSVTIINTSLPDIPSELSTVAGTRQIYVDWKSARKATSYNVYMSTSQNGAYTLKTNVLSTNAAVTGLTAGSYWFKVSGVNSAGEGLSTSAVKGIAN